MTKTRLSYPTLLNADDKAGYPFCDLFRIDELLKLCPQLAAHASGLAGGGLGARCNAQKQKWVSHKNDKFVFLLCESQDQRMLMLQG